jgi:uncharacterized RDD family membrane protein YckC
MFCPRCGKPVPEGAGFCPACGATLATPVAPVAAPVSPAPTPTAGAVRYGGFWRRFLATVIDSIILTVATWPVRAMMGLSSLAFAERGRFDAEHLVPFILAGMAVKSVTATVAWIYYAWLESSPKQATLGKMVLGLRVTDLNGGRISFLRATGRYFAGFLSIITFCIGYLMIAFTEKKQGLHDIIAGTLVRQEP